jgi:OTU domain-containing protein 5
MDYLVVQKRFFEQFIEGDFDCYINEKRKDGIWGDDIELEALSEIYNRPIEIYSGSEKPLRCFHEDKKLYSDNTNKGIIITPIRLSYHGRKHYNSIIPMKDDTNKYRDYMDNIIRTKPGEYEKKIISFVKDNEERLDKGIQLSEEEYRNYLKKFFSGKKKEEILDEIILKLNKISEKIHDIKKKEDENSKKEKNKNNQDKDDSKIEKKELEKEMKKEEIKKEKNDENERNIKDKKNNENNDNEYLNNSIIKSAIELGFDLDSAVLAWSKYENNKELAINYLISMKEQGKSFGE